MRVTPIVIAVLATACDSYRPHSRTSPPPQPAYYPPPQQGYAQPGYSQPGYTQPTYAQGRGQFTGTFANKTGRLTIEESYGQVRGTLVGGGVTGTVQAYVSDAGAKMSGTITMSDGSGGNFTATIKGNELAFEMQGRKAITLTRATRPPVAMQPPPQPPPQQQNQKPPPGMKGIGAALGSQAKVMTPSTTAATGAEYRDELDGWSVRTPDHWKYAVKGTTVIFGSDTEAGAIFVTFGRGWSYEQMDKGATAYIQQIGAQQIGRTQPFKAKAGKAIVVELGGTTAQGPLHGRAIGVAGPRGAVTVLGVTTPEKIDGLRKRVDQIALSAAFFEPKQSPAMAILAGPWWHYHGTSVGTTSSSYERTIELCLDGTFFDSTESAVSVSSGQAGGFGQGAGAGRWTAEGNNMQGRVRLMFNNGNVEEHKYAFKKPGGGDVEFDGRWYGRDPDKAGNCR